MRPLPPSPEPVELTKGRAIIKSTPDVGNEWYDQLSIEAKDAVWRQRVREQGYLCAYTELRITGWRYDDEGNLVSRGGSHIEHLFPQAQSSPDEKIAYDNMVVCVPSGNENPGYGAIEKGNWPDRSQRALFVRPVDPSCGTRFMFGNDGQVVPANFDDVAATETIRRLSLSDSTHPESHPLVRRRRQTIQDQLNGLRRVEEVRKRIDQLVPGPDGRLPEFITARRHALERRLRDLAKIRKYGRP